MQNYYQYQRILHHFLNIRREELKLLQLVSFVFMILSITQTYLTKCLTMTEYITEKGAQNVRNFKYKGGSISISYQHLWSPLAQAVVKLIPKTVAPNLITVVGTLIHIIGNLSLIVQGKGAELWPLSLLLFGICVFVYYTIDNVDGKQARRTHNSSPLGMCMDHGCDVLGVSFITLGVAQMASISNQVIILFSAQIAVVGIFWMSVWSQYHSKGILVLGKVNAVDDGIPFIAFLGIFTFFMGQDFWKTPLFGDYTYAHGLIGFVWGAGLLQIAGLIIESGSNFTQDIKGALKHLIHFPLLSMALLSVVTLTNWHKEYFYAIYFTTALIVVRDTSYMHVCVVAQDKYNQWQVPTVGYIVGYIVLTSITYLFKLGQGLQSVFVYGMLLFVLYNYFSYVSKISRQMANILGIRIFHVDPEKLKRNN